MGLLNLLFKKPKSRFTKVPFHQYVGDWINCFESRPDAPPDMGTLRNIYDKITLPKRSSDGSAGYDFMLPFSFKLKKGESITIPTGICCQMEDSEFLMILPRSGQGFKYRVSLVNTAGIIDSDYFNNRSNLGHIMIKIVYDGVPEKKTNLISSRCHEVRLNGDIQLFLESESESIDSLPSELRFDAYKGIAQGIIIRYGRASEDKITHKREGGFGSSGM